MWGTATEAPWPYRYNAMCLNADNARLASFKLIDKAKLERTIAMHMTHALQILHTCNVPGKQSVRLDGHGFSIFTGIGL
jgi:hypothetical protein